MLLPVRVSVAALAISLLTASCSNGGDDKQGVPPGDVFFTGAVTDDGAPVAGATVSVIVRDEHAEATAKVGDSIPMLTAGEATTGADGEFTVEVDPAKVPTSYFVGGQDRSTLNYDLHVTAPMARATWSSTMRWHDQVWRSDEHAVAADKSVVIKIDLGTKRQTVTDSFGDTTTEKVFVMPAEDPSA